MTAPEPLQEAPWAISLVPPLPAVVQRILALSKQEHVGAHELVIVIRQDPSFSAEVLSFANSALFGVRCRVTSLTQAVALLGMNRVESMATFVAVNNMVRSSVRGDGIRKVWLHSVVTAILAEEAANILRLDSEFAYTGGLLHDLGILGLMSSYSEEYARMLEVSHDFGFDLLSIERDLFDIDHCAAGAFLAHEWSFPEKLASVIATHHDEPVADERSIDNIIRVSWRLADTLGYAAFAPLRDWSFEELTGFLPQKPTPWLGHSADQVKLEIGARLAAARLLGNSNNRA